MGSFSPATCASEKIGHRWARSHASDSQPFRCFLPFLSRRAAARRRQRRTKIPQKSKAVQCVAVLPEQKCFQTRKSPQRILYVFSRALTQYGGISARQNRMSPCLSMASSARKRASASECAAASRYPLKQTPQRSGVCLIIEFSRCRSHTRQRHGRSKTSRTWQCSRAPCAGRRDCRFLRRERPTPRDTAQNRAGRRTRRYT